MKPDIILEPKFSTEYQTGENLFKIDDDICAGTRDNFWLYVKLKSIVINDSARPRFLVSSAIRDYWVSDIDKKENLNKYWQQSYYRGDMWE